MMNYIKWVGAKTPTHKRWLVLLYVSIRSIVVLSKLQCLLFCTLYKAAKFTINIYCIALATLEC